VLYLLGHLASPPQHYHARYNNTQRLKRGLYNAKPIDWKAVACDETKHMLFVLLLQSTLEQQFRILGHDVPIEENVVDCDDKSEDCSQE
jgi:hypothetical protein